MKLEQHVQIIKNKILSAFTKQLLIEGLKTDAFYGSDDRLKSIIDNLTQETGSYDKARIKLLDEYTFTLFNRIAALKVMEAKTLIPETIIQRSNNGDRSFAHKLWLEQNPGKRNLPFEALDEFISAQFRIRSQEINLFSDEYIFDKIPSVYDLKEIISLFNDIEEGQWKSDDIMGRLYESYNKTELKLFKESEAKIEYDKVSLTSQVYTPKWVVKFLVDNSLGNLYLEMFPDSELKDKYLIANAPKTRIREPKKPEEIKLIDPAPGSGNFLLYAFDLFYDIYLDQDYDEDDIPKLIIENNLYGIDIDDRAIQIAQLGLYIKAKEKNRSVKIDKFNIVSSDFYLPEYESVKHYFENNELLEPESIKLIKEIWDDLSFAHKFGSLLNIEEKFNKQLDKLITTKDTLFGEVHLTEFSNFRNEFFPKLKNTVAQYSNGKSNKFIKSKTIDSLSFLEIITSKYDIAVANPPYTDSADFGPELKRFVEQNYKSPYKFHSNLYSCFIKKCIDLCDESGKIGLIHPHTFMFIKSFEDVRKYILEKLHINIFVDYGLDRVNLFGPGILLDATFYVLEKNNKENESVFITVTFDLQEKYKKEKSLKAFEDCVYEKQNSRIFSIQQFKLKLIKSYPFIYWISDEFRLKFKEKSFDETFDIKAGLQTGNNNKFLRYWWEIYSSKNYGISNSEKCKWFNYSKGGESNKWAGNLWLLVNWENNGIAIKNFTNKNGRQRSRPQNTKFYFLEGITCSGRSSSKGMSYRYLPPNHIFDIGATGIFVKMRISIFYTLGFLNTKLVFYIIDCLNPTVNTSEGDVGRIPFVKPLQLTEQIVSNYSALNVRIKERLNEFSIFETRYNCNPIILSKNNSEFLDIKTHLINYYGYENLFLSQVLINEAIINETIFEVYSLSEKDKQMVLAKEGVPVGSLPVLNAARDLYLREIEELRCKEPNLLQNVERTYDYIRSLPAEELTSERKQGLVNSFSALYQNNNDLEEFCIKNNVNPINVWYLFKQSNVLPSQRSQTIAMELLVDFIRELLMEDDDGIIPLEKLPGERSLMELIEQKFFSKGFTTAQYSNFSTILGRDINSYLNNNFFKDFSDHLNLFMYLPKTPFIWHLSSGQYKGFECFIIIYKWSRDTLFKLRSVYVDKRESVLNIRLNHLINEMAVSKTAAAMNETELIRKQLIEITDFKKNLDELLSSGYDPKLDDGVGKNIAPLQKRGMLKYDVLNPGQLNKYLNADW